MRVVRLGEDDWETLREIRLRSLTEDRPVLGSAAREQGFAETHWRMRLRGSPWFVALHDARPVGLVSLIAEPGAPPEERHVTALWVAPEARGSGAGEGLLAAVGEAAVADGAVRLTAWVRAGDDAAAATFTAAGFAPSGVRVPVPRDPSLVEERWSRDLS